MARILIFAGVTGALAWISRASLAAPRSHGFYRFFAWECIVALVLLNAVSVAQWFAEPLSPRQLASWLLLMASIVPVILGPRELRIRGRQDAARTSDASLLAFEKTTRLVTSGVYRYIRHPMYSSLLLLAWGIFLKRPDWVAGGLTVVATGFLVATAKAEEGENLRFFGADYATYRQKSRMFIPFIC